jgi:RhtB (resistance to homoserine/threonine) family protein
VDGILHFETFLLTGILLNITPGNDTIFILSRSIAQGRKAGIISALGIGTGCLVHTLLAAFGLSLVIAKSMLLFNIIKYTGAVYLVYMGYKMLTDKSGFTAGTVNNTKITSRYLKIYRDAILTNLLNPKVALFFIAFLPQFIDPGMKNTIPPFLILGITFIITGTAWCLILAIFAASLFSRLKSNTKAARIINVVCGCTLVGLGVKVAISGSK